MRAILHVPRARRSETNQEAVSTNWKPQSSVPKTQAMALTLACDLMFLLVAVGVGLVFQAAAAMGSPEVGSGFEKAFVAWSPTLCLTGVWLWFLLVDGIRGMHPTQFVPFDYTRRVVQHVYLRRLEISIWIVAFSTILLYLCLSLATIPLFSKLFLSAVMALVVLAVRKSIPLGRLSFAMASGVFLLTLGGIVIANIVMNG